MFRLKEVKHVEAEVLVTGLPGFGRVGHVAANYIVDKLGLEPFATLHSHYFPHMVIVDDKGVIRMLNNVFFYVEAEKPFILLTGDVQPSIAPNASPEPQHKYAEFVLDFAVNHGVKEIYTMAGIDIGPNRFTKGTGVVCAGTDEETVKKLTSLGCEVDRGGSISGIAGLLLGYAQEAGLKGGCIMGKTSGQMTAHGDPGAAAEVLKVLQKLLGFEIDVKELEEANKEIEKVVRGLMTPPPQPKEERPEKLDYII
ncbi:MAG: hypothetical protein GXO00_02700 [Candidatus Diapherotrites archaeon]|nr:hypothetical protein [Candidatus Diapherotrites archaeon]